ncbi:MAG: hypothetical protein M1169_07905 [Firmicutes bacterium]|nr:hypothetical protein [Bacillota bacterium]
MFAVVWEWIISTNLTKSGGQSSFTNEEEEAFAALKSQITGNPLQKPDQNSLDRVLPSNGITAKIHCLHKIIELIDEEVGGKVLPWNNGYGSNNHTNELRDRLLLSGQYNLLADKKDSCENLKVIPTPTPCALANFPSPKINPEVKNIMCIPSAIESNDKSKKCAIEYIYRNSIIRTEWPKHLVFVPVPDEPDDIEVIETKTGYYKIKHKDSDKTRKTAENAVKSYMNNKEMDSALIMLPEISLPKSEYQKFQSNINRMENSENKEILLLTGIIEEKGNSYKNSAVLSDISGSPPLFEQQKLHGFPITENFANSNNLSLTFSSSNKLEEDLAQDEWKITILDTQAARICVMICQDFSEPFPLLDVLEKCMPTLILCPVLNGDLQRTNWLANAHQNLVNNSSYPFPLVVANSAVLPRRYSNHKNNGQTQWSIGLTSKFDEKSEKIVHDYAEWQSNQNPFYAIKKF